MSTRTTSDYLIENAKEYADKPALSSKNNSGEWDTTTWSEFSDQTMAVAKSLMALGFKKGDKLCIDRGHKIVGWIEIYRTQPTFSIVVYQKGFPRPSAPFKNGDRVMKIN